MVYFIQNTVTGNIKIGISNNPSSRLYSLQHATVDHLVILLITEGTAEDEAGLHARFAEWRLRGEWFKPCDKLLALIASLEPIPSAGSKPPRREPFNILAIREEAGFTLHELADYLNVCSRTVYRWEHGQFDVHPIYRERLKALEEEQHE